MNSLIKELGVGVGLRSIHFNQILKEKPENIGKIDIDENVLTISNEFKEEKTNENEKWSRKEFRRSSFRRSFYLPENLKTEDIQAKYEDGILYIDIPKQEKIVSKSRTIEIK
jgi:HSP20 family protein